MLSHGVCWKAKGAGSMVQLGWASWDKGLGSSCLLIRLKADIVKDAGRVDVIWGLVGIFLSGHQLSQ